MFSHDATNFAGNLSCHVDVPYFNMAANHLSDYVNNLDPYVKKRYHEKISSVGIGPIFILDKAYDPDCLPQVESLDFRLSFLAFETSSYIKDQSLDFDLKI